MRSCAIAITALPMILPMSAAAGDAGPAGHSCGQLSSGRLVDADTRLQLDPDGRISGTDRFRDGNMATDGRLVVTFDAAFSRFDGHWGAGDAVPDNIWTGERGREPNS
jgi:hypothetical protein